LVDGKHILLSCDGVFVANDCINDLESLGTYVVIARYGDVSFMIVYNQGIIPDNTRVGVAV
jgi:hypothetical protein